MSASTVLFVGDFLCAAIHVCIGLIATELRDDEPVSGGIRRRDSTGASCQTGHTIGGVKMMTTDGNGADPMPAPNFSRP